MQELIDCKICGYQAKKISKHVLSHGITLEQYDALFISQGCGCAVCGGKGWTEKSRMPVDHDHETGKIRGILCDSCNTMLGLAKDNQDILRMLIAYLERNK